RHSASSSGGLTLGIGDDAALVRVGTDQELILTTDMCIEGVHFNSLHEPAHSIGHRALARSISDIAAMGGVPRFNLISIAVSPQVKSRWVKDVYAGIFELAQRHEVGVIGGDTAVTPGP